MAYFDNAATTYPKPDEVYDFMDSFYRDHGVNSGRGKYKEAQTTGALIADTRKRLQDLLHCPAKQVIFTPTDTIAMNMIIQGIVSGGNIHNVYISPFEHNAVTRTLHHFESMKEVSVHELSVSDTFEFELEKIRYQFDSIKPDFVIISQASNVFGLVAPFEEIFSLAKKYEAITLLDMAQTAGVIDSNIGLDTVDFAVFAGHKTLYGPTGISGFVMKPDFKLNPILFGGTGFESANQDMPESLPERFEMGTLNISGVAGLNAALKWHEKVGFNDIYSKEKKNRERLIELLEGYDFIKIVGNYEDNEYVGIVSCLIDGISSDSAGNIFDKCGIAVRTGLHCAPLAHKFAHTFPAGTVRFSVSYFTSDQDFEELEEALDYIEMNM